MDPKNASTLDPNLKEVYERVMGTRTTPQAPITPPPPQQSIPPTPAMTVPQATSFVQKPPMLPNPPPQVKTETVSFQAQPFKAPEDEKNKSSMIPVVIFVGAILILGIYTFFWLRFFNINLPFSFPF